MRGCRHIVLHHVILAGGMIACCFLVSCSGRKEGQNVSQSKFERSRLASIRTSLEKSKTLGEDTEFVFDRAIHGDIVVSGLAFLLLESALDLKAVAKSDVISAYHARLVNVRGMNAVLTMRNLESILTPGVFPSRSSRETVVATIRQNKDNSRFSAAEMALAETFSASTLVEDHVLLCELLLARHSPSQLAWVESQLNQRPFKNEPKSRELRQVVLYVVGMRR